VLRNSIALKNAFITKILRTGWGSSATLAVLSMIVSLLALCLCSYFAGASPLQVMVALFEGALRGRYALTTTLSEWVAMTLCGLAVLIPYRAGFFNVGGQGQLEVGAVAAAAVALSLNAPRPLVIMLALAAAVAAGLLAVSVPLILRLRRGASEVTTTIMMNFACIQFMYAMVTGPLKDARSWYGTTPPVPQAYQLPSFPPGSGIPAGMWVAALIALAAAWLMNSTVFGLYLRAVGSNRPAAVAAGIPVNRVLTGAVLMGAALAGLAGGLQLLGYTFRVAEGWSKSWGLVGIPIALLGGNPLGVLVVGFLFAILETGARSMQALTGAPAALIYLFQGLPVIIYLGLRASAWYSRWSQAAG